MAIGAQPPGEASSPAAQPPGDHDGLPEDLSSLAEEGAPELLPAREPWRSVLRTVGLVEQAIGTGLIVVILVLVLIQVAQRYLPGSGWPWTGEVARLALVWCTFMLSGYLMARDRHIEIRVVDMVLPPRGVAVVKLMAHAVVGATCIAMAYACYRLVADDVGQVTPAAEIPLAWIYLVPLVGFVLTALRAGLAIGLVDVPGIAGRTAGADR
jgi:TRAP-type C4-dicarboxylate transport system permease small subunit